MHNKNIHLMGRLRSIHKNLVHHANNAKHVFGLGSAQKKMGMGMIKHKKNHSYEEDNCGGHRKRRLVPLKFKY